MNTTKYELSLESFNKLALMNACSADRMRQMSFVRGTHSRIHQPAKMCGRHNSKHLLLLHPPPQIGGGRLRRQNHVCFEPLSALPTRQGRANGLYQQSEKLSHVLAGKIPLQDYDGAQCSTVCTNRTGMGSTHVW